MQPASVKVRDSAWQPLIEQSVLVALTLSIRLLTVPAAV